MRATLKKIDVQIKKCKNLEIVLVFMLATLLFLLPLALDFIEGNWKWFFFLNLPQEELFCYEVIITPDFISLAQIIELLVVIAYLALVRQEPMRLVLASLVLVCLAIQFVLAVVSYVLFVSPLYKNFYADAVVNLVKVSSISHVLAIILATLGNLFIRKPKLSYLPSTALLIGGCIGIFYNRFSPLDARCFVAVFDQGCSFRFSASELCYVFGVFFNGFIFVRHQLRKRTKNIFREDIDMYLRQLRVVHYYYKYVKVENVTYISPMWEKELLGCGLNVERKGRHYFGIPTLKKIKDRLRGIKRSIVWVNILGQILMFAVLLGSLYQVFIPGFL